MLESNKSPNALRCLSGHHVKLQVLHAGIDMPNQKHQSIQSNPNKNKHHIHHRHIFVLAISSLQPSLFTLHTDGILTLASKEVSSIFKLTSAFLRGLKVSMC